MKDKKKTWNKLQNGSGIYHKQLESVSGSNTIGIYKGRDIATYARPNKRKWDKLAQGLVERSEAWRCNRARAHATGKNDKITGNNPHPSQSALIRCVVIIKGAQQLKPSRNGEEICLSPRRCPWMTRKWTKRGKVGAWGMASGIPRLKHDKAPPGAVAVGCVPATAQVPQVHHSRDLPLVCDDPASRAIAITPTPPSPGAPCALSKREI